MPDPPAVIPLAQAVEMLHARELDDDGVQKDPIVFIDLDANLRDPAAVESVIRASEVVVVGCADAAPSPALDGVLDALAFTLTARPAPQRACVTTLDVPDAMRQLETSVTAAPKAALAMRGLVEATNRLPVREGLAVESATYSMLLAGAEFARWRAARARRPVPEPPGDPVVLERVGDELRIALNVPQRRNAYSRDVRDGLVDALDLALADGSVERVVLTGRGSAFCSGGDLDEFGSTSDVSAAHLVRLQRSAAARAHALGDRLEVRLHGACIGAGIEIPSFAGRVVAADDTVIALPELAMGLVPGAGGTVGITRRIGRWRCAWLHLSGARIGVDVALDWGLIDDRG